MERETHPLGLSNIESCRLGVEVDDALEIAEKIGVWLYQAERTAQLDVGAKFHREQVQQSAVCNPGANRVGQP